MRFESTRTSGSITEGCGFKSHHLIKQIDFRNVRGGLLRYLTKYLLIKRIHHYKLQVYKLQVTSLLSLPKNLLTMNTACKLAGGVKDIQT